jgi:xanthine dehydrogenase iron-sulfur cluster and FAD-binding subunit A
MIMSAIDIVHRHSDKMDEATIRHELEGNICRCTGYHNIVNRCWTRSAARRFRWWPNSRLQTTIPFRTAGFRWKRRKIRNSVGKWQCCPGGKCQTQT